MTPHPRHSRRRQLLVLLVTLTILAVGYAAAWGVSNLVHYLF